MARTATQTKCRDTKAKRLYHKIYLNKETHADILQWWQSFLLTWNGKAFFINTNRALHGCLQDKQLWSLLSRKVVPPQPATEPGALQAPFYQMARILCNPYTVQVSEKLNAFRVTYAGTRLFYAECGDSLRI